MIEWFSGSSRSETKYASGDDGATFIDNAPDTPAPLFVVRAFKTAIFGTPKPIEYKNIEEKRPQLAERNAVENVAVEKHPKGSDLKTRRLSAQTGTTSQENIDVCESEIRSRQDQLASPTKGILLTPGTAATRRKTVSFSARKESADRARFLDNPIGLDSDPAAIGSSDIKRASEVPRKQSALTKTLIELSTKRSSPPVDELKVVKPAFRETLNDEIVKYEATEHSDKPEAVSNLTLDLNQPCSRSGQHWKAEYDEYHKKSTREMRKIIQYGQNVKNYAAKKDSEATDLNERLQKELAKVARMETKVSKMAKQLRMATAQNPHGDSEQARLVGELAQQTAMAVRYQKKAEQYRKAIRRLPADVDVADHSLLLDESLPKNHEDFQYDFPMNHMQAELQELREIATTAEKKAARLEDENKRLKRSLARVKEEMSTYDLKRQAKEERLKKRDERHKASKEACEAELAKLKIDYNVLLQASRDQRTASQPKSHAFSNRPVSRDKENVVTQHQTKGDLDATGKHQAQHPSKSPRKRRPQNPVIDIWATESPGIEPEQSIPKNQLNTVKPLQEDYDIHRALQEIHFNPPDSETHHNPPQTNVPQSHVQSENIRPVTKPLFTQDVAEDPIQLAFARNRLLQSSVGKSASLLGSRVGSRTSTMGTARTSSLSAERAAAAKARLAERKRSGEKKKMQKENNAGILTLNNGV